MIELLLKISRRFVGSHGLAQPLEGNAIQVGHDSLLAGEIDEGGRGHNEHGDEHHGGSNKTLRPKWQVIDRQHDRYPAGLRPFRSNARLAARQRAQWPPWALQRARSCDVAARQTAMARGCRWNGPC